MTKVFTQDNELLKDLWDKYNEANTQNLEKQQVFEWAKDALQKTKSIQNFQQSSLDLNGLIKEYLSEIHQITQQSFHKVSLNYKQSVQFLHWLTTLDKNLPKKQSIGAQPNVQQDLQQQNKRQQQEDENNENKRTQNNHQLIIQCKQQKQNGLMEQQEQQEQQEEQNINRQNINRIEQNNKNKQAFLKAKTDVDNNDYNCREQEGNENQTSTHNQFNLQYISKKYKDYLKIIFQHYCKMSYATGQDPTFQQIMHKTTIMTINKFMMFAKDFQISKINNNLNRAFIIQVFKKNSQCYKQMSCQQFIDAFHKLAKSAFMEAKDSQNTVNQSILSNQIIKMLEYCELSTPKKFKEKMKRLNIQYRIGPKTNAELKVVPDNYRFKFVSNNGKSEEQVKQEVSERKINRSQRKIFLHQKINMNQHDLSLNRKLKQKNKEIQKKTFNYKQLQSQSTNVINKVLTPLIPPLQKKQNMPPLSKPPTLTPSQQNKTNNSHSNIFKKQLGYAELHKIKANESYSRKRINSKSSKINDSVGQYKLNSIVQEARIQVYENENGNHRQNLSESIQTNSREQTLRMKAYDINKINNKMQLISDKVKRQRQIQEQLNDLLDIENDDDDEFLREHLLRQKKNEIVGKRLSNRLNQLQAMK